MQARFTSAMIMNRADHEYNMHHNFDPLKYIRNVRNSKILEIMKLFHFYASI